MTATTLNTSITVSRPAERRPDRHGELDDLTLARARRGERDACRALVRLYQRRVFALLARMLSGRDRQSWVEDLAQETFLRVFRALPSFDRNGPAKLSTWILTIATRLSIDELRRKRPQLHSDPAAPVPGAIAVAPEQADDLLRRKRIAAAIEAAVAALPADNRAVFVLREYHGMAYGDIAEAVRCDIGTVKSRLSRARARLRQALEFLRQ